MFKFSVALGNITVLETYYKENYMLNGDCYISDYITILFQQCIRFTSALVAWKVSSITMNLNNLNVFVANVCYMSSQFRIYHLLRVKSYLLRQCSY